MHMCVHVCQCIYPNYSILNQYVRPPVVGQLRTNACETNHEEQKSPVQRNQNLIPFK